MIIDSVNLNHLRVFECVYRTRSMTSASSELHLTQSGVSQHVKSLEDMLGVRLFDRIKQRLVPTTQGTILFQSCSEGLNQLEQGLWKIKGEGNELGGTVSIGLPTEFGNNVVMPLISKLGKKHPHVKFRLALGFVSAMNEGLLRGELDFAFVDDFSPDRRVTTEKVYDEILDLCISDELLKKKGAPKQQNKKFFESLDYIEYQEGEPVLRRWFAHHLDSRNLTLNVKAVGLDAQGVGRLIQTELGAGVLPHHLVVKLQKEGHKLHRFKGSGKPLKNAISVAYLGGRTHSPAAVAALEFLKDSLSAALSALAPG
jgi:DNA-binding transcriptional LysR family regulator